MAHSDASRPLVGVTTSEMRVAEQVDQTPQGEPPRIEMALGIAYLEALERAGAVPVTIPPLRPDSARPLLERLSGLVLSGGPDIHPTAYGAAEHELLGPTWPQLDRFEISLTREADALRLPILAICRGAQALNVARSGTLFQHVPDRFGAGIGHRQPGYGATPAHAVEVEPGSVLAQALGQTTVEVNSYHHQAADELGRGLRAVAWSADGLIEAIEAPGRDFVVGVQWHAEAMAPEAPEQAALFRAFVEAATRYESAPDRLPRAA
ncbi:MAG TPA: gamma-glutamyl-gamma-aminobutyrate hydrolase family protein [Thermoleophilaceae bacterium]|nr:gamma-glutamyl-gamma-aminobutyrate hydrolase family protein [Thermoleophilaceae bacterium]